AADIRGQVKAQVVFYFSRENLKTDGNLVSKMNADLCIPLHVVSQLSKIKELTEDEALIAESVKDSSVCAVTPAGIKPTIRSERNTIILREIPSNTPVETVREIFTGEGMAPVKQLRSDVGDTWFVYMETEREAMATILALRDKTFDGKPVKARLKSENILRSFFPVPVAAADPAAAAAAAAAASAASADAYRMGPGAGQMPLGPGGVGVVGGAGGGYMMGPMSPVLGMN
ncbi:unnamed protein product, partial [Phaeothamnion confervicola]